jgi:hypothetical protein
MPVNNTASWDKVCGGICSGILLAFVAPPVLAGMVALIAGLVGSIIAMKRYLSENERGRRDNP